MIDKTFDAMFPEGDLVRSTNALYESYGVGYIRKIRGGQAEVEFNRSVFMQPPYRSENKILRLKELAHVDSPSDRATVKRKRGAPRTFNGRVLRASGRENL